MADETIAGFDFYPVEFDRDARLVHPSQRDAVLDAVDGDTRELLVLSHGWNNDMAEARRLYTRLLKSIAKVEQGRLQGRRLAVVGVFWPSKKFADADLIPGGAASLGDDLPLVSLEQQILSLRDVFDPTEVEALIGDAGSLDTSKAARRRFGEVVRERLVAEVAEDDELARELPDAVATTPGEELLDAVDEGDPVDVDDGAGAGGAAVLGQGETGGSDEGGAAGLGDIWRGVRSNASKLLNLMTYWAMKRRAGLVGRDGLNPLLRGALAVRSDLRLHLVGHSFGGRVVTAAVLGGDGSGVTVDSLVLLQAAFSHHGFAVAYHEGRDGFFRPVVADGRVRGPIVVTHTDNDLPNRWAYPAASRLAGHMGAALPGGPSSLYGAMGANGAQTTPEAAEGRLLSDSATYTLERGGIANLESSDYVADHGAVHGREIGNVVVAAMSTASPTSPSAFDSSVLDQSTIAIPLLDRVAEAPPGTRMHVTIDLNMLHPGGIEAARDIVTALLLGSDAVPERRRAVGGPHEQTPGDVGSTRTGALSTSVVKHLSSLWDGDGPRGLTAVGDRWALVDPRDWPGVVPGPPAGPSAERVVDEEKGRLTPQYVHAWITAKELRTLAELDTMTTTSRAIYKVWPDFEVERLITRSGRTVKADAAHAAFSAAGAGIVWAVADTGIQHDHEHFATHRNLILDGLDPIAHQDFVASEYDVLEPQDPDGHGTHVAGIIAGETDVRPTPGAEGAGPAERWEPERWLVSAERDAGGEVTYRRRPLTEPISGVAPRTKLVSLRVLDENGRGRVSNLLAAIGYVQQINDHGRWIRIHGLNLSVGYGFDPEWFACGQSPLCIEVDRLVRSGVSVVVAAGNTGYLRRGGTESNTNAGLDLTINDPGNADLAITVGATHRVAPHVYGVSYFSSKGPTGDGRLKPDMVAPGERIISCAAGRRREEVEHRVEGERVHYRAESGTSMAAPHVSGAIAAFLSIKPEFTGRPERVKRVFMDSATDLGRERYFQGRGLVDLMRAIQSV